MRSAPVADDTMERGAPILLFDGVCNVCNRAVQFVIRHDPPPGRFRFAALQSDAGRRVLAAHGLPEDMLASIVLVEGSRLSVRSSAALRLARLLGFPWSLLGILAVVPQALRDPAYDWFAHRRYRWFGKRATCMVPTPDVRARFLA